MELEVSAVDFCLELLELFDELVAGEDRLHERSSDSSALGVPGDLSAEVLGDEVVKLLLSFGEVGVCHREIEGDSFELLLLENDLFHFGFLFSVVKVRLVLLLSCVLSLVADDSGSERASVVSSLNSGVSHELTLASV